MTDNYDYEDWVATYEDRIQTYLDGFTADEKDEKLRWFSYLRDFEAIPHLDDAIYAMSNPRGFRKPPEENPEEEEEEEEEVTYENWQWMRKSQFTSEQFMDSYFERFYPAYAELTSADNIGHMFTALADIEFGKKENSKYDASNVTPMKGHALREAIFTVAEDHELTEKNVILDAIEAYVDKEECYPAIKDVAEFAGLSNTSRTAQKYWDDGWRDAVAAADIDEEYKQQPERSSWF